jgi:hypothetical protein
MHSIRAVLLLAAFFAAVALATPTPTRTLQKRSFKHVFKRAAPDGVPNAGPAAMRKAYNKFGFLVARQAAANTTGSMAGKVAANPEPNAAEYLSPVNIGGQTLNLDFDTGSSDL